MDRYESKLAKWETQCHRYLAAYLGALSDDIVSFVEGAIPEYKEGTRANILAIRALITREYGGYKMAKGEINFLNIRKVPKFTSPETVTSGSNMLTKLYKERASWKLPGGGNRDFDDDVKKAHLMERMQDWDDIAVLVENIELEPDTTLAQVRAILEKKCTKLRAAAVLKKNRADSDRETYIRLSEDPEALATLLGKSTMSSITARAGSWETANSAQDQQPPGYKCLQSGQGRSQPGQGWAQQGQARMQPGQGWMQPDMRACYYCGNNGHVSYECTIPYCYHCRTHWMTVHDQQYHHNTQCSNRLFRGGPQRRQFPPHSNFPNTEQQPAGGATMARQTPATGQPHFSGSKRMGPPQWNLFKKSFKTDYVRMNPRAAHAAMERGNEISYDDDGEAYLCFTTEIVDEAEQTEEDTKESLPLPSFRPKA